MATMTGNKLSWPTLLIIYGLPFDPVGKDTDPISFFLILATRKPEPDLQLL